MNTVQQFPVQNVQEQDEDFIDIGRLFRVVLRYKWGILGLALVITLFTGLMLMGVKPVYRASASVMLESGGANLVGVEDVYAINASHMYLVNTQFNILQSRDLVERVVRRLHLYKHPVFVEADAKQKEDDKEEGSKAPWYRYDFKSLLPQSDEPPPPEPSAEEKQESAIHAITNAIVGGLTVKPVDFSLVAHLSFESTDPKLAAQVVNAIAEEFIAHDMQVRMSGTLQATDWLNVRLDDLKSKLHTSEQALQDFRDREGLVEISGVTGLGSSELNSLVQRLDDARKKRIEAQNIKDEVQGMGKASTETLMTLPAVLQHQLIRELKREQSKMSRKVAELGKRYGPKHPKMIAARSDLTAATGGLAREVRKVVSGINREYQLAMRNEQQLQVSWEASKTEVQDFNRKEFQLRELQREVDTNRQLYEVFFTRIKSVSQTGGFEKPHARIVDRAITPGSPFKPNKKRSLILALVLGLMLGSGIAILLDVLDNTIKSPDDVQDKLRFPLLGSVPKMATDKNGGFEQFWQQPQSQYAEALRTIRTGVVLSGLDDPAKIIVVTSTVPGEGKSTIALNLGSSLGQMEKTLVIGADLRRPSLAKLCQLTPNHPGLSHFVSGTAELDACVEYLDELKIYVMPAGVIPPNPLEMLGSKKFIEGLTTLKQRFDRIVIDTPPLHPVSDALVLASYADSVIYVVKADSTSATQAKKSMASILASNEPLTGVVLNQFDIKKASKYYGSKYYKYGDYYQSDTQAIEGPETALKS
ncbi:MAG: polysaccharide biosynthesis tyrosine autokinase [Porticoccaceae bacterium]|nr:polysaccharide biosynthesis tyrosine autokinase [Porticoccaceae bacterium]